MTFTEVIQQLNKYPNKAFQVYITGSPDAYYELSAKIIVSNNPHDNDTVEIYLRYLSHDQIDPDDSSNKRWLPFASVPLSHIISILNTNDWKEKITIKCTSCHSIISSGDPSIVSKSSTYLQLTNMDLQVIQPSTNKIIKDILKADHYFCSPDCLMAYISSLTIDTLSNTA
jgi:hypothetical protein